MVRVQKLPNLVVWGRGAPTTKFGRLDGHTPKNYLIWSVSRRVAGGPRRMDPAADRRRGLRVGTSSIAGAGTGLFTTTAIPYGEPVGIYSGDLYEAEEWQHDDFGVELGDTGIIMTPVKNDAVDFEMHPFAAANEPPPGAAINLVLRTEAHDDGDACVLIPVFYTVADVGAGDELLWYYGESYERVYATGVHQVPTDLHLPKLSAERVARVVSDRADAFYKLVEPPSRSDSSDDSWSG